jgi:hypothetical protein
MDHDINADLPVPPYHEVINLFLLIEVVKKADYAAVKSFGVGGCVRS